MVGVAAVAAATTLDVDVDNEYLIRHACVIGLLWLHCLGLLLLFVLQLPRRMLWLVTMLK